MEELLETFLTYSTHKDVDLNITVKNKRYDRNKKPTVTISGKIIINQIEINLTAEIKNTREKLPSLDERFPVNF
jgi:hypothetical protein